MPLMQSDDTVIFGLSPKDKRGRGTPTRRGSEITFIQETRKISVSQSLIPIRRSYKLLKNDLEAADDNEDPYE